MSITKNNQQNKTILVIGNGFLGSHVLEIALSNAFRAIATHKSKMRESNEISLDITDIVQVENVIKETNPDYVINCAAHGDIDFLEGHQDVAISVNCDGAANVAKIADENDSRLIHISTDSVFDGIKGNYSETDTPNPINAYARSKLQGETEVSRLSKNHVIVRTNFYGMNQRGMYFFNWILDSLRSARKITGFTDIVFSPLDATTLSKMIIELLDKKFNGVIHLSSGVPISKYDFILHAAKSLGYSTDNISAGKYADLNTTPRPKNTSLKNNIAVKSLRTPIIDVSTWITQNKPQITRYLK